mmetsp:Transcript_25398/g.31784  ORF Transcript_25398/g.31784 Transcript_25398/m.31784 type:complete len:85 (+) Transcript_25398:1206-1460(+)
MTDVTKKICSRIGEKRLMEEQLRAQQAESYTATLSHEMRTPLASIMFFLDFILKFITRISVFTEAPLPNHSNDCERALKYINLI